jgi:hypothetical protein
VSEQLLDLFKLGMLALLYLFFARVIWAVWSELRTPAVEGAAEPQASVAPRPGPGRRRRAGASRAPRGREALSALCVVEPAEASGTEFPIGALVEIGRTPGCDIALDDTYVSARHARIREEGEQHRLEDLGSTNGTLHNGEPVVDPVALSIGDRIQVGHTVLEVR